LIVNHLDLRHGGYIVVVDQGLQDTPAPGTTSVTQEDPCCTSSICHEVSIAPTHSPTLELLSFLTSPATASRLCLARHQLNLRHDRALLRKLWA